MPGKLFFSGSGMFILHSSNKTENLLVHLAAVMQNAPLDSPFKQELFLLQSQGMERWLSQQLASEFKVWANFRFLFPGRFFATLSEQLDSTLSDEKFDRHLMLWRFEAALRKVHEEVFIPLTQYLHGENQALKRFQLAQQLAQLFDQYQMMRPDMLALWQQGKLLYDSAAEPWQRALWLQVTEQTGFRHRGALWLAMIEKLNAAESGQFQHKLPDRVHVFGINSLPPLFLNLLQGLSRHCDVHFYLLNPAQVYWGDAPGKKLLVQLEQADAHPLLALLGQQGREFQQMILEQLNFELELDSFEKIPVANNLQQLQNDLLANRFAENPLQPDGSIGMHACHSRLREVQVIKNQLLSVLEQNPDLALRDMVVMAPDIQLYAPFISAVFDDVQHAIADRSLRLTNTALDVFIRFLQVCRSRFGWQGVLDLLEQPVVYGGFGLSEAELDLIRFWIEDTRVRWGRDSSHKQELGLPPSPENTWRAALDRLLMGYAVADDTESVDGVLPYRDIEGLSAQALGGFHDFLQTLFNAVKELGMAMTLSEWSEVLSRYTGVLLGQADAVERQQLNELLQELTERYATVHHEPLTLDVMIDWLESRVSEHKSSTGFLRGQLTFCSMLPMRSIPFQVIALMGMNDGEFPKIDRHPTFDLLAQNFRPGDRSRRADDRYQFLEIILSARRQLIISYVGQSQKDQKSIPPSVIVSEFLEILADVYHLRDVVTNHPLQPFSSRYFDGACEKLFSYDQGDCETARNLGAAQFDSAPWWHGRVETNPEEVIDIAELCAFYRHPQRYFMQRQLGLRFIQLSEAAQEREPFSLDGLEQYAVYQEWIEEALRGNDFPLSRLRAQGRWLSGTPGELLYAEQQQAVQDFVARIRAKNLGDRQADRAIDIGFGTFRLTGKLSGLYQHGSMLYRYSDLKGKDFILAWLHHLLINQLQQQTTFLLSKDHDLQLVPALCADQDLQALITIFLEGQQRPDVFFTEAAFDFVQQTHQNQTKSRSGADPLKHTLEEMKKRLEQPYEEELGQLFNTEGSLERVFGQGFADQCQTLLLPVWEAVHAR